MIIGHRLKQKRNLKRLSQQEIADFLNISQRTYSNFESNKSEPSLTQLLKLSEVLEFNLLDILKEQGITFNQHNNEFKDNSQCIALNNNESEKLIKQFEARIEDLKEINKFLKDKIASIEKK